MLLAVIRIPSYTVDFSLNCAKNIDAYRIDLKRDKTSVYNTLLDALRKAPDSAFRIWDDKNTAPTRRKNRKARNRVQGYIDDDWNGYLYDSNFNTFETPAPDYSSIASVIRSVADGNGDYKGSFFGSSGNDKGSLFHEFKNVNVGSHTSNNKKRLYIKFIAPGDVINEKSIFDEFQTAINAVDPNLRRENVKKGGANWEVASYHGSVKGER